MFVFVPETFVPPTSLPTNLSDDARLFLHIIETRRVIEKRNEDVFVPLKKQYLRRNLGKHADSVISELLKSGDVERDNYYQVGKKSFGYKLGKQFDEAMPTRVQLYSAASIARFKRLKKAKLPLTPIDKFLKSKLGLFDIDYQRAIAFIKQGQYSYAAKRKRLMDVKMLREKDFFFFRDRQGRRYSNFTSLAKDLRQFLSFNKQECQFLDIANSQPMFLAIHVSNLYNNNFNKCDLMSNHYDEPDGPFSDLKRYITCCETGSFYQTLAEALKSKKTIKELKSQLYANLLFCSPKRFSAERAAFGKLFPTVLKALDKIKEKHKRDAALLLQRIESHFIIETVCKRIWEERPETPLITIHDCLLLPKDYATYAKDVLRDEFAKKNLNPLIHID